jgi:hypothetical protein
LGKDRFEKGVRLFQIACKIDPRIEPAPNSLASGFFAQGDTFKEARANLQDVIEGNVILALQLGLEIPVQSIN